MELSEEQKVMFETVVSESFQSVLQNMLTPVVNLELLKRKEALTEKEVEALYGISANTLRTKRARGGGPTYRQGPYGSLAFLQIEPDANNKHFNYGNPPEASAMHRGQPCSR